MTHLTQPCPACSGSGRVPRSRRRLPNGEPDNRDIIAWPEVICDTCSGSGVVPVRPETIVESSSV